jgi:hypothetical protein
MKHSQFSPEVLEARIAPAAGVFELGKINGLNGFQLNGEVSDDQVGNSVSGIGDFNGDGLDDFIVGASESSPNGVFSGGASVIFGTRAGFPASLDLASLDGSNGFKIKGEAAGDSAGIIVSSAGDVNGDGKADLIIGAPGAAVGTGFDGGAAYIVFGTNQPAALLTLSSFDGEGIKIEGSSANSGFASVVSGAGDFNGDGFDDVLIGAPTASAPAATNVPAGACYVIFGGRDLSSPINVSALTFSSGFRINAEAAGDLFGISASRAGDVNGDSFDDIIIGASAADSRQVDTGASYVIFGSKGFTGPISLSSLNGSNGFKITGENTGDNSGLSVAAGDVNGDGFSDVIIGSPSATGGGYDSGAVAVLLGNSTAFSTPLSLGSLSGGVGFKIVGEAASDMAGAAVRSAGDFNGDGVEDFIIGAPGASPNGDFSGASYLLLGTKSGFADVVNLSALDAKTGLKIIGAAADDESGVSVSGAGDVNGDGYGDLIVGARGADASTEDSGAAYVIYGYDPRVSMSGDGKTFTFTEADGDVVTLKISQPGLLPQNIVLAADGSIESLDLTTFANTEAAQAVGGKALNLVMSVKTPTGGSGNGFTKVGLLNAKGVPMGKVKIAGDLGQIVAGGSGPTAVKSLTIGGNLGSDGGPSQLSKLTGAMKKLNVFGNLQNDSFEITGKVGAIKIQKSLIGAGALSMSSLSMIAAEGLEEFVAEGNALPAGLLLAQSIGKMKVGKDVKSASMTATKGFGTLSVLGDFDKSSMFSDGSIKAVKVAGKMISDDPNTPSTITARNKLDVLIVNGNVENARILVGYDKDEQPVNPDARVGRVLVKGDWLASSLVAGIADSTNDGFGRNDTVISGDTTPSVLSRIASVVIKGNAIGSAAAGDHFGISAQQIRKLSIAGESIGLSTDTADDIILDETNNDFRVVEIG